jgi:hypothetical protein
LEDVSISKLERLEDNMALLDLIAKSKWNYKIKRHLTKKRKEKVGCIEKTRKSMHSRVLEVSLK